MENKMTVFESNEFGQVRTVVEDGKILFCASDVAKALGYSNAPDAVKRHCRCVAKRDIPHPQNTNKILSVSFIPEGDIYRLIIGSKLPTAEKFEQWLFEEVVPSIRKTGGYVMDPVQFLEENFASFSDDTKRGVAIDLCKRNVLLEQKHVELTNQLEEQKPKVDFAEQVEQSEQTFLMRDYCKFIQKKGLVISDRKLYKWFIDNGFLNQNKLPYQKYHKYFEVVEYAIHTPHGVELKHTTRITGKGQVYFTQRILDSMREDLICG